MARKYLYWDWIKVEALKINSDGCSRVIDFRKECCYLHDLAYYYGRDPKDAYKRYLLDEDYWAKADRISRKQADQCIKQCYHDKSPFNGLSPFVWTRYIGVRLGGWWPWRNHRKLRP
jgi:hypothetical protein